MILSLFTKCNVTLINAFDLKMSSIISIMDDNSVEKTRQKIMINENFIPQDFQIAFFQIY